MKCSKFLYSILLCMIGFRVFTMDVGVTSLVYHDENPYLEIYSRIISSSVQFASNTEQPDMIFANIEYLVLISNDSSIYIADKYQLVSPPFKAVDKDFWDLKRYALKPGNNEIQLRYVDLNNPADTFNYVEKIFVESGSGFCHSDVLLTPHVDTSNKNLKFDKAGFYFEPLSYNLFGTAHNSLVFYLELYNTYLLSEKDYFVQYYIVNQDDPTLSGISHKGYRKLKPDSRDAILNELDISSLKSGNYTLVLELKDRDKLTLHTIEERFAVYHPLVDLEAQTIQDGVFDNSFVHLMSEEELNYALKAILPKIGNTLSEALNLVVSSDDIKAKRYFLYNFWFQVGGKDMKIHYDAYMEVARAVDKEFSNNVGYGFETDRGFYFLKYGRPSDTVVVEDEPSAPPYEIWIYNHVPMTQQTNVKFLFYNPSLVSNDFILLHSTCRGEIHNPRWEVDLYSDALSERTNSYINESSMQDNFNRNAKRYFTDF